MSPLSCLETARYWGRLVAPLLSTFAHSLFLERESLAHNKMYVNVSSFTLTETLRSYFSQYGEVVDCVIMKDKTTNQSRGFGFVKFKDPNCVGTVLASRPHTLDGRNVSLLRTHWGGGGGGVLT